MKIYFLCGHTFCIIDSHSQIKTPPHHSLENLFFFLKKTLCDLSLVFIPYSHLGGILFVIALRSMVSQTNSLEVIFLHIMHYHNF